MSSSDCAASHLARDDLLELVHLEPVEDAALDRLDQVARLEPRLLARVAAHERCALEHDVVELARAGSFAPTAQTSAPSEPLAAEDRVLRGRGRDDDVLLGRLAMRLSRLGADASTERGEPVGRAAVGDRRARSSAPQRECTRPATPPGSRSRSRRASRRRRRARCLAATPVAAPGRSCPSVSASITPTSSPGSSDEERRRRTTACPGDRAYVLSPA